MAYVSRYLTHWVGRHKTDEERFAILTQDILAKRELLYSNCNIPFGNRYGGIKPGAWGLPMVCFTDIPFSEIEDHCTKYSDFGVVFHKVYLMHSCVTPVWYCLSPIVFQAYSFLFHHISGLEEMLDGQVIPNGQHSGSIYSTREMLKKLHCFIALCQNYFVEDFAQQDNRVLEPSQEEIECVEGMEQYYSEREWRAVNLGDPYVWNTSHDGKDYFRFSEKAVHAVIVPRTHAKRAMEFLTAEFKGDSTPLVYCYEDLKDS